MWHATQKNICECGERGLYVTRYTKKACVNVVNDAVCGTPHKMTCVNVVNDAVHDSTHKKAVLNVFNDAVTHHTKK